MKISSLNGSKRVLVVGAGFSGLTSAFYLRKSGFDVEILEMKSEPGGLIGSIRTELGLVETAANGLLNSRLVEDLFADVGCALIGTRKEAKARFLVRDGKPRKRPLTMAETATMAGLVARYLFSRDSLRPESGESLRAWSSRVMTAPIARVLAEGAAQGIYSGDPERLSASLCAEFLFTRKPKAPFIFGEITDAELAEMEPAARKEAELRRKKDRRRALRFRGSVSAEGGMGQLIEKLEAHLKQDGVKIRYGARALLTPSDAAKRPVVVATAFPHARELVEGVDPERARSMNAIAMLPLISVTAFYRGPSPRLGFGVLFPPIEKRRVLGVLFNNCIFDGRVEASKGGELSAETWIIGGALAPKDVISVSDEEILNWIDEERARAFGARGDRVEAVITRWPEALPHYTRELEKRLPHFRENRENIFLVGNYLGQIGLGKILEQAARLPGEIMLKGRWG